MPRFENLKRKIFVAILLGVATLATNLLLKQFEENLSIPLGNIFLFLSAGALGVSGALFSVATGVVPETLLTGEHFYFLRIITLCLALGYLADRAPRVPSFLVSLALWSLLFSPALFYLESLGFEPGRWNAQTIIFTGLTEILLTMISGVFLLNPLVWGTLTCSPRHVPIQNLLIHVVTMVATLSMFTALMVAQPDWVRFHPGAFMGNVAELAALFLLGITLPTFMAWRLGVLISRNHQEFFGAAILGSNNTKSSFSGLSTDFWRRKKITEQETGLAKSAEPLEELLGVRHTTTSPVDAPLAVEQGIISVMRNGSVSFINDKFRELAQVTSNEVLGKDIKALHLAPALEEALLHVADVTFRKGPQVQELKLNRLPDKLRFFELSSQQSASFSEKPQESGPDSVIISVKDITDRRTVEWHLLQGQKLESLGALVVGISHAFNNSLTAITGQASYAKYLNDPKQIKKALDQILESSQNAGTLVRQLIEYASGRPSLFKTEDLADLLGERLDLIRKVVGSGFEISYERPQKAVGITCDINLIMQAITNLVMNSRDACNDGGKIEISIDTEHMDEEVSDLHFGARPGDFARLRIRDYGIGMSPETLSRAFEPLFTTKAQGGHAGLGLSIVFAIVRAHDGFLTVESRLEKGTTVSIYIPLQPLRTADQTSNDSEATPLEEYKTDLLGNSERILVVEDEATVRDLLVSMLSKLGYSVRSVGDGQQALKTTGEEHFDLVLVDMVIPKMRGTELISKLKEMGSTKTILMTGYDRGPENVDSAEQVLQKPFDIDTLGRAIKTCLSGKTVH